MRCLLLKKKIQIHAQIVVCPEINDGKALERTINDLNSFAQGDFPVVLSAAVVPVGLTRFRPSNDGLIPVDSNCATKVINQVESMQKIFYKSTGSRFAWLSDEWYLIAKKSLPTLNSYEDLPQKENGVGSIRSFLRAMEEATINLPTKIDQKRTCSWVVGKLVENELLKSCKRLNKINNFVKFCIKENQQKKRVLIVTEDKSRINNLISFFEEDLLKNNTEQRT